MELYLLKEITAAMSASLVANQCARLPTGPPQLVNRCDEAPALGGSRRQLAANEEACHDPLTPPCEAGKG